MKSWTKIGIFAFSALSLGVVACSGSDGSPGPAGAAGADGAAGAAGPAGAGVASAGLIVPNVGLLDRELDVTVTAQSVDFTAAAPTLDFGAGVTASKVQVLSPTTLVVHLAVDAAAKTGARDVKITAGAASLTSKAGFTVAAPVVATFQPTTPTQGGLVFISLDNLDTQHAFDSTEDGLAALTGGPQFPNFFIATDDGLPFGVQSVTSTQAVGAALLDPVAPATGNVEVANIDASGNFAETYAANSFTVTPRTPTPLTIGTALAAENIAAQNGTNVYKFSSNALSILEVTMAPVGTSTITPDLHLYGDSGTAADIKNEAGSVFVPTLATAHTFYVVAHDQSFGGGAAADFGYSLTATAHAAALVTESATAHGTIATAQAATLPAIASANYGNVVSGALSAGTEIDMYKFTLAVGENVTVVMDTDFDGAFDITDNGGTSLVTASTTSSAGLRAPTFTTAGDANGDDLVAGTYYVVVTSGDGTVKGNYNLVLRRVPAGP